jgi:hypothetical protein
VAGAILAAVYGDDSVERMGVVRRRTAFGALGAAVVEAENIAIDGRLTALERGPNRRLGPEKSLGLAPSARRPPRTTVQVCLNVGREDVNPGHCLRAHDRGHPRGRYRHAAGPALARPIPAGAPRRAVHATVVLTCIQRASRRSGACW